MPKVKKIAIATSSRADYGLLYHPIKLLLADPEFDAKIIVTGSHLSKDFGRTIEEIKKDNIPIFAEVPIFGDQKEIFFASDAFGRTVPLMTRALSKAAPDLLIVLGDRYEILACTIAAGFLNIPIAHLCGGDITEGAFDNVIRDAITKFSHIHFPSNYDAAQRIEKMGEDRKLIFMVGSPGLDYIRRCESISKEQLLSFLKIENIELPIFVITFQPVTLEQDRGLSQLKIVLEALQLYTNKISCNLIFTGVNADSGSDSIGGTIKDFCASNKNAYYFNSLGSTRYINLVRICEAVVGNSSSGFYEAPFLKKLTVNIGNRQSGRLSCKTIINANTCEEILEGLKKASLFHPDQFESLYGDGNTAERIVKILKSICISPKLLMKTFKNKHENVD